MIEGISHIHLGLFTCSAGYAPRCPKHIFVFQNKTIALESDHSPRFFLRISCSKDVLLFTPIHQHCSLQIGFSEDDSGGFSPSHPGASTPPPCKSYHLPRRQLPNWWWLSGAQFLLVQSCLYFMHLSHRRIDHQRRISNCNKHWNIPSWCQLHHPSFSSARLNLSSFYSPPKGDTTTPSLSSMMGESLWRAVVYTPWLHVSLGAVAKMDGLTTQP